MLMTCIQRHFTILHVLICMSQRASSGRCSVFSGVDAHMLYLALVAMYTLALVEKHHHQLALAAAFNSINDTVKVS